MEPYVDSNNYEMMTDALTDRMYSENNQANQFFEELKAKVRELKQFAQEEYDRRIQLSSMIEDEEWDNPEELSDFDASPAEVAEANYAAWNRFAEELSTFESDSDYLSRFIDELHSAAYNIGGLE